MKATELTRGQMNLVKVAMLCRKYDEAGVAVSYGDLLNAGSIISDEEFFEEYDGTEFYPEDFD